ncbi:restriction endonuclease [Halogeometricum luteum]|uniref:Restriction endonuclease n=1 Tax=Halogeometricum luteum TaxID=2950537 RepID=A0ABU2G0L4_9EURY|nr:restriction endonuclease [Halogeometricum sp. S3BR5-2]MDS0293839.1 restriction endonuclease [Halogeometricum sp. S3BR5-2]
MTLLDDLSGFEFEDVMEDVFRKLGYQNVRQSEKTGDEGRDILMEERVNGQRRGIVVECKHKDRVGRPVVQKLHSAVTTYDFTGPKRGIIVTTGSFTDQAREYTRKLRERGDGTEIQLIDGSDLREMADDVGLDLYNGRIEIVCDQTLRPIDPAGGVDKPVRDAFRDVANFDARTLSTVDSTVRFEPVVSVDARTDATFETSVGVIHRVDERDRLLLDASGDAPSVADGTIRQLVADGGQHTVRLDDPRIVDSFSRRTSDHFGQSETDYKEWTVDRLRAQYTTTVEYTGDNNVDYEKECEPQVSDVSIQSIDSVYVPRIRSRTTLKEYEYSLEYYAAGPSRSTVENGIGRCVHCGATWLKHTYCDNCGSINCRRHTRTERLEGEPVCTGCAVSDRFALRKRFFYDEENLATFREQYEDRPVHMKAMENKPMVASTVAMVLFAMLFLI